MRHERIALEGDAGGDVDDPAAARAPEGLRGRLAAQEQADHVDVQHPAPLLHRQLVKRLGHQRRINAGIVDEHVQAAVQRFGMLDHRRDLGGIDDVDLHAAGRQAARSQRLGRLRRARDVADDHARALLGQVLGHCMANAAGPAGDDDHRVLDAHRAPPVPHAVPGAVLPAASAAKISTGGR